MSALYAWGANSHGQLGLGFASEQVLKPVRVEELPDHLCESSIKGAFGGGGHTFLLTLQGKLYGAGWNISGQVGDGTQVRSVSNFQLIRGLEDQHIVAVACGWSHSIALSSIGQVWVWGSNSHSQLGLPKNEVPFSSLPICLELCDVVHVAAGLRHSVVVTRTGQVFTWGHGNRGQLGLIDEEGQVVKQQVKPMVIEPLEEKVIKVACGQYTTYALTVEGNILAWGDNKWGQLAHDPKTVAFFSYPLIIPPNYFGGERALWVKAGWTHCAVGLESGEVYVWGRCDYGQLGPLEDEKEDSGSEVQLSEINKLRYRYVPNCLVINKCIQKLSCGSEHNLALVRTPAESVLYSWGWNEHGNCGDGSEVNVKAPFRVPLPGNVQTMCTGCGHSLALVKLV